MADFAKVLKKAQDGYHQRKDYPAFAMAPWDDRNRWTDYLTKINQELDAEAERPCAHCERPDAHAH